MLWQDNGPLKRWYPTTALHGVTTLKREAAGIAETLVIYHNTKLRHNPEEFDLYHNITFKSNSELARTAKKQQTKLCLYVGTLA
jgi:hypothetical protein